MGKKVGVEIISDDDEACARCGMTEKDNGCCHDEHKFFKLEIPGKQVSYCTPGSFLKQSAVLSPYISFEPENCLIAADFSLETQPPLPDYSPPRLYVFQCVYRL